METCHIFRAAHEPATRFDLGAPGGRRHIVRYGAHRLVPARCCHAFRWAKNCTVQVYYDGISFWCRDGKGCKTEFWKRVRKEIR